jgi:hypothetical protein
MSLDHKTLQVGQLVGIRENNTQDDSEYLWSIHPITRLTKTTVEVNGDVYTRNAYLELRGYGGRNGPTLVSKEDAEQHNNEVEKNRKLQIEKVIEALSIILINLDCLTLRQLNSFLASVKCHSIYKYIDDMRNE